MAQAILLKIAQANARCILPIAVARIGDRKTTPSMPGDTAGRIGATTCNSPNTPEARQAILKTSGMAPTRLKTVSVLTQFDLYSV